MSEAAVTLSVTTATAGKPLTELEGEWNEPADGGGGFGQHHWTLSPPVWRRRAADQPRWAHRQQCHNGDREKCIFEAQSACLRQNHL